MTACSAAARQAVGNIGVNWHTTASCARTPAGSVLSVALGSPPIRRRHGLLDRSKIIERSNAIKVERQRLQVSLTDTSSQLEVGAERLRGCLALLSDILALYQRGSDQVRRQLNATFERFYLDDDHGACVMSDVVNQPSDDIRAASAAYQRQQDTKVGARTVSSPTW